MSLFRGLALVALGFQLQASALAQSTTRVSLSGSGAQPNSDNTTPAITPDGRFAVFDSLASNLVPGDTNGTRDIFVRDRASATTELVSAGPSGSPGDQQSYSPSVSDDGRFVVFSSFADDLVPGDTGPYSDVFIRDRLLGVTTAVSVDAGGQLSIGGGSSYGVISNDGRWVLFVSDATNLGASPGNSSVQLYERSTGARTLIVQGGLGTIEEQGCPALSSDGRFLVWGQGPLFQPRLLYVLDRASGTTILGSSAGGVLPDDHCFGSSISDDGRYLAFLSRASNLVSNDANGMVDVFVADLQQGSVERVNEGLAGAEADADSWTCRINGDARFVAFDSSADNLVSNDTNGAPGHFPVGSDVFLRDRLLGRTERVSLADAGGQSGYGSNSWSASASADGRQLVFCSDATDLVAGDTNGWPDIFVRDRGWPAPAVYCTAKLNSLGCLPAISFTGLPSVSGPDDFHVTATNELNQRLGMLLWSLVPGNVPFHGGTLCLAALLARTPIQNAGGSASGSDCSGVYSFHFTQGYMAAHALGAGASVYAQYWSRDPGFPPPDSFGLTDGLVFVIAP